MQQIDPTNAEAQGSSNDHPKASRGRGITQHLRRFWHIYGGLAVLLGLALLPPLINVSRFQRRIASSIGGSLGRPVHLDRVSLVLLPLPGFEISNLVVDEDPAFGAEPIIRANTVRATLRLSSLWRRRVEFSTISFTEPSLNLVHTANGKWNIEGVLLQASHIAAAPTDQHRAGSMPRFPYIEATGARINFKRDAEKTPFSLVDSEFALWSPDPNQWRLRLRAKPTRTDTNVSDTGLIQLEGTIGHGDSLAHIPINLEGRWQDAPLGEASKVVTGDDAGWRGNIALTTIIRGTLGENAITARLRLLGVRRADFIPEQPLSAEVQCFATGLAIFYSYEDLRCSWTPETSSDSSLVALTGRVPDIRHPATADLQMGASGVSGPTVLDWLRIVSPGIPNGVSLSGKLVGSLVYDGANTRQWSGQLILRDAGLKTLVADSPEAATSLLSGDLQLQLVPAPEKSFLLIPASVLLGGHDPATLEGRFDSDGFNLHLSGMATDERLLQFASATGPLGTGLMDPSPLAEEQNSSEPAAAHHTGPVRIDLSTSGAWNHPHRWGQAVSRPPATPKKRTR